MEEMVKALKGLNGLTVDTKINNKIGQIVDAIDVDQIIQSEGFKTMLGTTFACRAAGIDFHAS